MSATVHTLYRFFDEAGALLYVGRTIDARGRWRDHEKNRPWFDDVATVTRVKYETAEDLAQAERAAIVTERPLHNVALNVRSAEPADDLPSRLLYGLAETALRAGVSKRRVESLVREGEIETVLIGRRRLVPAEALTEYVERLRVAS